MASLDFPSSPTNGQTYSSAGITWTYDSTYTVWNVTSSGPVGYSGSQGYTGSKGDIGYSGSLGYTGSAGTNGTNGYNGSQGYTGSASTVIGYTGSKGDIGYTGSAGTNGYTGSAGTAGYTGSLGYSGSSATINWMYKTANYTAVNNDGILADTTSASFTVTLPASPATGTYVSIVDVTSTFATNPLTVAGNGETLQGLTYTSLVLNVTSAKVDLIYEGSYWAVATTSGTRGYTGSLGYTGSKGTDGYTGSQGYSGSVGYTGSQGYNGSQGYTGSAGYTGSQGYTGSASTVIGYTGSKGDIGYTGSQGYTGSASTVIGYTGSKGDIGYTGSIPAAITATSLALGGATLGTNNLAVTGTTQLSSSLGIGMSPSNVLDITQNQNAESKINLLNSSAGTGAISGLWLQNGTHTALMRMNGASYTTSTVFRQDGMLLYSDGAGGLSLITGAAQPIYFGINSVEKMRLDASGNFGIGITPSAWNTFNAAQVGLLSIASYTNGDTDISSNLYYNSGWKYIGTGRSAQIKLDSSTGGGDIKFLVDATGGTAAGATAGTEAARIDSSGNLLVGTTSAAPTSPTARLTVAGNISTTWGDYFIGTTFHGGGYQLGIQAVTATRELRLETITGDSSGVITFYPGAGTTERVRITTDGLGIGGTPPSGVPFYVSSGGAYAFLNSTTGGYSNVTGFDNGTQRWSIGQSAFGGANGLQFFYGTTEGMRLDSSGSLCIASTSSYGGYKLSATTNGGAIAIFVNTDTGGTSQSSVVFRRNTSDVGSISTSSTNTSYNTSSDARLKTNVSDAAPASALIDAIQVRQFDWKVDNSHQRYGMVAQELLEVAPEAVSVPTDPEQMMGVDYSKLVPMLIKEVQSLRTRLAALENK